MMEQLPVLGGSAGVVLLMIGIAAALGFRRTASIDEAALAQLAANEGARVDRALITADGRQAFARLNGGKILVARVMGADVSARIAPASAARVRIEGERLSVRFGDLGYPPLNMSKQAAPPWLAELAGETP